MKKIFIILIILLSFNISFEFVKLPDKGIEILKCVFDTKDKIEQFTKLIKDLYTTNFLFIIATDALQIASNVGDCIGVDLYQIIYDLIFRTTKEFQQIMMLKNLKEAKAPILLRKYLFDIAVKNDVIKAKKECYQMTQMHPYDNYKSICDIFNTK